MTRRRWLALGATPAALLLVVVLASPDPGLYDAAPVSTAVLARDGSLLRLTTAADGRFRLRAPLAELAPAAVEATLLYEDRGFRRHLGVSPGALARAFWTTYLRRERVVGGSTITMQLARLRFGIETRTLRGKLEQIARALQLERHHSKDEILEAYLNRAPYGGNVEGLGTAALVYFGKPASELSLAEAIALAVVPQDPNRRAPPLAAAEAAAARARLAAAWVERHPQDAERAALATLPLAARAPAGLPFAAPHYADAVLDSARAPGWLLAGTLDPALQALVERELRAHVARHAAKGVRNAAALLIDRRTMEVLAQVGSAGFFDAAIFGQVDGTRAPRSPGSALKPFVYALALEQGLIHPLTLLKDAPRRFGPFTPENFDRGFLGPVTATDALVGSRNLPAVELAGRLAAPGLHGFLKRGGVDLPKPAEHYGLALVLGGGEVTMQDLVRLYAMLANGGELKPLRMLRDAQPPWPPRRMLSPEAAYLTLQMLAENPRPDAIALEGAPRYWAAWKTGTSWGFRDAWTVGTFGRYVLAVWLGEFDRRGDPAFVGRELAAPLFFRIADGIAAGDRAVALATPSPGLLNLRQVAICAASGDLPNRWCPQTRTGWFIPGVSPIRVSEVHRPVRIDRRSGLRACSDDPRTTRLEVYEFWPSDLLAVFKASGLPRRVAPRWSPGCSLDQQAATGLQPRISTPVEGVDYALRADRLAAERIPFAAVADADARRLYWFVDDRFVGDAARDEPLLWQPSGGGSFLVRVTDDQGRANQRKLTIKVVNH